MANMERGMNGADTAPHIGYDLLTDMVSFSRVMSKITATDIQRLATMNSTDVYRINEVAVEAAAIYSEKAQQAPTEDMRRMLGEYAARSLAIAGMLSEHTNVVDQYLGTPAAHLVSLVTEWKHRDPSGHQEAIASLAASRVEPKPEASRVTPFSKRNARIVSVPIALAAASAIIAAQPAAASSEQKSPVRDEMAKNTQATKHDEVAPVSSSKQDTGKQQSTPQQESSVAVADEIVAGGIPHGTAAPAREEQSMDMRGTSDQPKAASTVSTREQSHQPDARADTPPFSATPVDLDTLLSSEPKMEVGDSVNVSPSERTRAEREVKTVGQSKAGVSEVVPTTPVQSQVNLDTFSPGDANIITVNTPTPTSTQATAALPNIDKLFEAETAIDKTIVATEPAAQRPVELPKPEAPKPAPQEVAPAAPIAAPQEHAPYQLSAEQSNIIDTLNLSADKKAFLKQVTAGAIGLHLRGSKVNPEVVIAQSILESGWGASDLTKQANNYFGMKASSDWTGKTISMPTGEFISGRWVTVDAQWRAFDSAEDCFAEYAKFIEARPHFADALQYTGNPEEYVKALVNGNMKYATDPDYVQKIMGTVRANRLSEIVKIADNAEAERSAKAAADAKAVADAKSAEAKLAVAKQEREAANPTWHLPVPPDSRQSPQYPGHKGIDYAVNTGTPFFASIGGTVKVLTFDVSDAQFCKAAMANIGTDMSAVKDPIQREVRITTKIGDDTYEVIYAHMSQIDVKDGQVVEGGQKIGLTGGSGCSTGPHAHFEIRKNGKAISPTEVLNGADIRTMSGKVVVVAQGAADPAEYEDLDEHGHIAIHRDELQASETVYVSLDKLDGEAAQNGLTDEQKKWWNAQRQLADWKKQAAR